MIHSSPALVINKLLIVDLLAAKPPCFALGYIEVEGELTGCFIVRPEAPIPNSSTEQGFRFGHSLRTIGDAPLLHFAFEFYDHAIYSGLVNPTNSLVQDVLTTMVETRDYFFFALNPDNTITAFRSEFDVQDMAGLESNVALLDVFDALGFGSHCTPEMYERAAAQYATAPEPEGRFMAWACRDNPEYLDMAQHRLPLNRQ